VAAVYTQKETKGKLDHREKELFEVKKELFEVKKDLVTTQNDLEAVKDDLKAERAKASPIVISVPDIPDGYIGSASVPPFTPRGHVLWEKRPKDQS